MYLFFLLIFLVGQPLMAQTVLELIQGGRLTEARQKVEGVDSLARYRDYLAALAETDGARACSLYQVISWRYPETDVDRLAQERLLAYQAWGQSLPPFVAPQWGLKAAVPETLKEAPAIQEAVAVTPPAPPVAAPSPIAEPTLPPKIEKQEPVQAPEPVAQPPAPVVEKQEAIKVPEPAPQLPVPKVEKPTPEPVAQPPAPAVEKQEPVKAPEPVPQPVTPTVEKQEPVKPPEPPKEPPKLTAPEQPSVRPVTEPPKTPHDVTVTEAPGFWVQVGAFGVKQNADKLADKLRAAGLPVEIVTKQSTKALLHHVRVGSYPTREAAQTAGEKLKQDFGLDYRIVEL
jgi:hypothetical protein